MCNLVSLKRSIIEYKHTMSILRQVLSNLKPTLTIIFASSCTKLVLCSTSSSKCNDSIFLSDSLLDFIRTVAIVNIHREFFVETLVMVTPFTSNVVTHTIVSDANRTFNYTYREIIIIKTEIFEPSSTWASPHRDSHIRFL